MGLQSFIIGFTGFRVWVHEKDLQGLQGVGFRVIVESLQGLGLWNEGLHDTTPFFNQRSLGNHPAFAP